MLTVNASIANDGIIIFLLLLIGFETYFKITNNYKISWKALIINAFLLAVYLYYRIANDVWHFTGFSFIPLIKYFDVIVIYTICNYLVKIFYSPNKEKVDSSKGFYLDMPLGKSKPDLLNREKLATYICEEIDRTSSPDSSFAIGISSEWGYGKTSFFDLLERHLDPKSNITIKINPWINHDSKNIVKDFFNVLSSKLSEYNSNISPIIKKYAEILVGVGDSNLNKVLNPLLKHYSQDATVNSEFNQIDNAIKELNRKLVIFIDDLDRLYKDEIIQVVKLIRNSANFGNTVFVVAYDRNYIINALKEINNYNPEFFLEKIFQLEIRLPNFESQIIQKRIFNLLSSRVSEEDKQELLKLLLNKKDTFDYNIFNSATLTTLRDATRFCNSFLVAYSYLNGEVVLSDLLNLEALRLKYPGVYKLIFFQSEEFLETKSSNDNKTFYTLRKSINNEDETGDSKNKTVLIKDYLENNYNKVGIPKSDIDKAVNLLYSLFPSADNLFISPKIELLSVANPLSFERYSHYRLLDNNVSEIEFGRYRSKTYSEFCEKIKEWIESGQRWELKRRFENIKAFANKEDFEKIIKSIFYFARYPKVDTIDNDYSGFDFENLYSKLNNTKEYLKLNYYKSEEEYREFIISIFNSAPSPYSFDVEFIYSCFDRYSISYEFIVPKDIFQDIRLEYLRKFLLESASFSSDIWHMYHYNDLINVKSNGNGSYNIQKLKNPEATNLIINFLRKKALDDFLIAIITKEPFNAERYAVSNVILQMFTDYIQFETFLNEFDPNMHKYLNEFLEFFNVFKEKSFRKYVEFKFNKIPVN